MEDKVTNPFDDKNGIFHVLMPLCPLCRLGVRGFTAAR
jgi:hypothetical protein